MNINTPYHTFSFTELMDPQGIEKLDGDFLCYLKEKNANLYNALLNYRNTGTNDGLANFSEFIIDLSQITQIFIADLFGVQNSLAKYQDTIQTNEDIFNFKKYYVTRMAVRQLKKILSTNYSELDDWLSGLLSINFPNQDKELSIAKLGLSFLENKEKFKQEIEWLIDWCTFLLQDPSLCSQKKSWAMFAVPKVLDNENLVSFETDGTKKYMIDHSVKYREGFKLTDHGMNARHIINQINNCMFCHKHEGDYCSKGFPITKQSDELMTNTLGNILTGCPLDIKISEMLFLQKSGHNIAALAILMLDNPLCPLTGHRICNDCMKSCIYQKHEPVNVPQIESNILKDVLSLPFGFEIYDLLSRWNPLIAKKWMLQPYNHKKILIVGAGPSGIAMAYYLLKNGCGVVMLDGLKIEPMLKDYVNHPIQNYADIYEELDKRITWGFGGVAEYGITSRWDKNLLKVAYISLLRKKYFRVFGDARFGGTITVEHAWEQGFDHLVMAVGAGLPKELPMPGSLNPGMRQANDFLMALHLTGLNKEYALATYQVRLPALVIGGGLTAVDTATEVQIYYIKQVEKIFHHYTVLIKAGIVLNDFFSEEEMKILNELVSHGQKVQEEKNRATALNIQPNFNKLVRNWGGVSIVYRKRMQDSPAYKRNHEELQSALTEGIFYIENFEPTEAILNQCGHIDALKGLNKITNLHETLPARSIFTSTGTKPNIAYEFEHRNTFNRQDFEYKPYHLIQSELHEAKQPEHIKDKNFGAFTSYNKLGKFITFIGDAHPAFHGNVVNAIASATKTYPLILDLLKIDEQKCYPTTHKDTFFEQINHHYSASIVNVQKINNKYTQIVILAPQAASMFSPGQFYRLQAYETNNIYIANNKIHPKAIVAYPIHVDKVKGNLVFNLFQDDIHSKALSELRAGQKISLMGPTGARIHTPSEQIILIFCDATGLMIINTLVPLLKTYGNKILVIASSIPESNALAWRSYADEVIWFVPNPSDISVKNDTIIENLTQIVELLNEEKFSKFFTNADQVFCIGDSSLLQETKRFKESVMQRHNKKNTRYFSFLFGPMQCMLKGVCGQCLQWQVDPVTGKRTKAVFSCSWQCQPMELIDFEHLASRNTQNSVTDKLQALWFNHISDSTTQPVCNDELQQCF